MGRPRKDSQTVDAKQRLVDSFWNLLESNKLHQVTVGMIAEDAACNRGTFYYHYADMDDLIQRATEQELLSSDSALNSLFGIMKGSDKNPDLFVTQRCPHIQRIAMLVQQGGFSIAYKSMRSFVLHLWTCLLCPPGTQLKPETVVILEYAVCALFGVFVSNLDGGEDQCGIPDSPAMTRFASETSQFLFAQLCKAQGVSVEQTAEKMELTEELIDAIRHEAFSPNS